MEYAEFSFAAVASVFLFRDNCSTADVKRLVKALIIPAVFKNVKSAATNASR